MRQNDGNAKDIVAELRSGGGAFEYWVPSARQRGLPDGVYGFAGFTVLVEFKMPEGRLSAGQQEWHRKWLGGPIRVLRTVDEAKALKAALLRAAEHAAGLDT